MDCRICSFPMRRAFDLRSHRHGTVVPVFRCGACDAYFSDGTRVSYDDADLRQYYLRHADHIRTRYDRVFGFVETLIPPGRFLDIGAGLGLSLEVAGRRGWESAGIEPNRALAEDARERGLDVDNRYLDDTPRGLYDLVLIDNVLEHVHEPMAFLRRAIAVLAPSGLLVVAVPPMDWLRKVLAAIPSVRERVTKPQLNIFVEVDEHVNMLGRRAMARLVELVGMHVQPLRFHHSKVFDNPVFRALGLDDGYYAVTRTNAPLRQRADAPGAIEHPTHP